MLTPNKFQAPARANPYLANNYISGSRGSVSDENKVQDFSKIVTPTKNAFSVQK